MLVGTADGLSFLDLERGVLRLQLPNTAKAVVVPGPAMALRSAGSPHQVGLWDLTAPPSGTVDNAGTKTNLRVCRDSVAVVPVLPLAPADTVWAPPEACETD